jgi:hypothetical protein
MHRQHFAHGPRLPSMAYGFVISGENDRYILWHYGESARFSTMVALLPEVDAGLFVSYNTPFNARETLSAFLDRYYPPEEHPPPQPLPGFPARADRWAGAYIPMRTAHTGPQKIVGWIVPLKVSMDERNLLLRTPFGNQRYAEIELGLLKQVDGERLLGFREDSQGNVTHLFWGPFAYFRATPFHTLNFQLPFIVACLAFFVSTLIVFPVAYLVHRRRGENGKTPRAVRAARWLAAITGALNLILSGWFLVLLLDYAQTYVWPTEAVSIITRLWLLSVPLTLGIVALAVLGWKDRY